MDTDLNFILWHVDNQIFQNYSLKVFYFLQHVFLTSLLNNKNVWVFNSVPLVYVSVFVFIPRCDGRMEITGVKRTGQSQVMVGVCL